jgi:hypothetical protein
LRVQGFHGGILYHESYDYKMYIMEEEAEELESTNSTTATIKLAKY